MKSQAVDPVAVAAKDLPGPAIRDPVEDNFRRSSSRARGQIPAVRTESDRQHCGFIAEDHQALPRARVPNAHGMIVGGSGQKPPVRAECRSFDARRVSEKRDRVSTAAEIEQTRGAIGRGGNQAAAVRVKAQRGYLVPVASQQLGRHIVSGHRIEIDRMARPDGRQPASIRVKGHASLFAGSA